ncbi:hypothetical protein P280DRAFT_220090 [Massarina eburnea CBS 473.64]|uniref:Uncharacterized protein n=1 Tax=Massarina eburnea CBS 473.64 TaxID=1395130 RepID=A0A6A6S9M2_9PLEO|nr:hypothetical protein P280DRAFT_220090 [Massarina eburnea CBS 473.64]
MTSSLWSKKLRLKRILQTPSHCGRYNMWNNGMWVGLMLISGAGVTRIPTSQPVPMKAYCRAVKRATRQVRCSFDGANCSSLGVCLRCPGEHYMSSYSRV